MRPRAPVRLDTGVQTVRWCPASDSLAAKLIDRGHARQALRPPRTVRRVFQIEGVAGAALHRAVIDHPDFVG